MPKTHQKHTTTSFTKGDLVEYVGKDHLNRGIGVVLEEVTAQQLYFWYFDDTATDDKAQLQLSHIKVYWQTLGTEETLHKARVRRIPEITKAKLNAKKKA